MKWLIVEDALRDRTGHWFEYISAFVKELRELGDEVALLVDKGAEDFIKDELNPSAILPTAVWYCMKISKSRFDRYFRIALHNWQTLLCMRRWFNSHSSPDVIFVPTVEVHHLAAWIVLIKGSLRSTQTCLLLHFIGAPIQFDCSANRASFIPAPTSYLFRLLIRLLKHDVNAGRVVLAVETQSMSVSLSSLTGVSFKCFPQPVSVLPDAVFHKKCYATDQIVMGSYGGARHEKGDIVLVSAIKEHISRFAESRIKFILQTVGCSDTSWQNLHGMRNVHIVSRYFETGEYARYLQETDAVILPYRTSSYALRGSRVAVEAMVNGIPIVTVRGTTLATQGLEYGAVVLCEDGDIDNLVDAIHEMEISFEEQKRLAVSRVPFARKHFSVEGFRWLLCLEMRRIKSLGINCAK